MSSTHDRPSVVERTASAVGVALLRRDLGALGPGEEDVADDAVRRGIRALPDTTRVGVQAAAALCGAVLCLRGRGDFLAASAERQEEVVEILTRRPLPVVAEFVKLTRGLALVAVVDRRTRSGALS